MELTHQEVPQTGARVDVLRLEGAEILRIGDIEGIGWPAQALFRDLDRARLEGLAAHLPAGTVDAAAGTIGLSFNIYAIRAAGRVILIDAGVGNGKRREDRPAWHLRDGPFLRTLAALGIAPEQVDIVVNTHLHADHVGWNTQAAAGGWAPTFPNARHAVPRVEFDHWSARQAADPGTPVLHGAFADSVLPLHHAGRLDLLEMDGRIAPGLAFEPAPGHSPGMCIVRFRAGPQDVVFTADVIHHPLQFLAPDLVSNFCADPERAKSTRLRLLADLVDRPAILAPYHFPSPAFGRLVSQGEGLAFVPLPR